MINDLFIFIAVVALLLLTGLYSLLITKNMLRILIAVEILMKAVTLLIIAAGYLSGRLELAQALAVTVIIIEVVAMAVAAGLTISIYRHQHTLDIRKFINTGDE